MHTHLISIIAVYFSMIYETWFVALKHPHHYKTTTILVNYIITLSSIVCRKPLAQTTSCLQKAEVLTVGYRNYSKCYSQTSKPPKIHTYILSTCFSCQTRYILALRVFVGILFTQHSSVKHIMYT